MAHGDAREGKWRGNWRMEWVDSTPHTTSEHGVSNITNADVQISAASSRLNWSPRRFKWTRSFRRKTKYGFCACAITFQLASTTALPSTHIRHLLRMYSLDSFHLLRFALWEIPDSSKFLGTAVAQWLRCCATNRKVAGSIPVGVIRTFHWHNPSDRSMAVGSIQPLTEMGTRSISWGWRAAGA